VRDKRSKWLRKKRGSIRKKKRKLKKWKIGKSDYIKTKKIYTKYV